MAVEKDQTSWLPEPPPPRPARRDAAIQAALRKFDGTEEAVPARPKAGWASTHRPQLAVAFSAMLLVIVGVPAALIGLRSAPPPSEHAAPPKVAYKPIRREASQAKVAQAPAAPMPPPPTRKFRGEPGAAAPRSEPPAEAAPTMQAPPMAVAAAPPPAPPPPPPPPVASAERDALGATADDLVVTGSRIASPALESGQPFAAKTGPAAQRKAVDVDPAYASFLSRLQAAVRSGDRRAVIALAGFPLRVNFAGGARTYRDAGAVARDFDRIFTPRVKRAILAQHAERLFVRDLGAMVGTGQLWFDRACATSACPPPGPVRITAVNP